MRKLFITSISVILLLLFFSCDEDKPKYGKLTGYIYLTYSNFNNPDMLIPFSNVQVSVSTVNISTNSASDGSYTINGIKPGEYTVTCAKDGYSTLTATVTIAENQTFQQNFTLKPENTGYTLYVAPWGDDSWPGTITHPLENPGFAALLLEPGDTLYILMGDYFISDDTLEPIRPKSGTPEKWITIKGEPMTTLYCWRNMQFVIDLSNSSYIRIQDLEITSENNEPPRDGIVGIGKDLNYVIIDNVKISSVNEFGINIGDINHMEITNCDISYCGFGSVGGPAGEHGGWRNVFISDCIFSNGGHFYVGGENPYDRPDGFGIEESDGPIEICFTKAEHNKGDGLDSKARNTYIHHCIVANNSCDGVKLWGGGSKIENTLIYGTGDGVAGDSPWAGIVIGTDEEGADFEVVNVTLHDNNTRYAYPIYVQYDDDAQISLLLRNTIIAGGYGHSFFGDSVTLTADHNIFYSPYREDQVYANGRIYTLDELELLGVGNICKNPLFIHPAWGMDGNFKLQATSPAIDSGTSQGAPTDDLECTPRPQGTEYDKGAYEQ
ncbi:MAG: carboxypeptidase regulatory-like domain-containing protein [Acidobacteria bacterium]|nr:carboxypeptidase regulatory-like domain-containing protein [Acidobacteriota bacterium]